MLLPSPHASPAHAANAERTTFSGGTMAELTRAFDWSATPLGPLKEWSPGDLGALNTMLGSPIPTLIHWGPEFIVTYNDAALPVVADLHPLALGRPFRENWPEAWELLEPQLTQVLHHGKSVLRERLLVPLLRNGVLQDFYWTYSYSPIVNPSGEVEAVLCVCRDITEELSATNQRDALAGQLNHVLEATTDGVMNIDRGWRITYANPIAMKSIQPVTDILGKNCWQLFPSMIYAGSPFVEHYEAAMYERIPGEFEAFYPDPLNIWFQIQPRPSDDGIVVFFRDITEQKKTNEALIKNEKLAAVGRLAASIAHEINNPLESVTNLLFLARNSETLDEAKAFLLTADQELRRVSAIANQTLKFHKQASNATAITCEELTESILSIYHARMLNASVTLEERNRCALPVTCFEGEIRQVLANLVGNGVDAMSAQGGRLLIRSRNGHNWKTGAEGLVITVADTGSGIAPAVAKRIFEPFFTTKGFGGTGLGLWVSQEIVARHKGTLQVRSRQGQGTVFTMFLPFEAAVRAA